MIHCDDSSAVLIQSEGATLLYTGDGRPAYHFTDLFPKDTVCIINHINKIECRYSN